MTIAEGLLLCMLLSLGVLYWRQSRELTAAHQRKEYWWGMAEKLEGVLRHYANEDTWSAQGGAHSPAFKDRGRKAREALR